MTNRRLADLSLEGEASLASALGKWARARPCAMPGTHWTTQAALAQRAALRLATQEGGGLLTAGDADNGALAALAVAPWDSELLGVRVGRGLAPLGWGDDVEGPPLQTWRELAGAICRFAREANFELSIVRADTRDAGALSALQRAGFVVCDTLVTLALELPASRDARAAPPAIDRATPGDQVELERIASSFRSDHFHADPRIAPASADRVYQEWTRAAIAGRAAAVLVARAGNDRAPSGFVTCVLDGEVAALTDVRHGVIDLIAVDPAARRRGIGGVLVRGALEWFRGAGCTAVRVGTQVSNLYAVRAYLRAGFMPIHFASTLHGWRDTIARVHGATQG